MMKKWHELVIYTNEKYKSEIEFRLIGLGYPSFEIIDTKASIDKKDLEAWLYFDKNIFKGEHPGITFKVYGNTDQDRKNFEAILKELTEEEIASGQLNLIDESDWENNWKDFYHLQKIGDKLLIKPTWEEYDNTDNRLIINLDPGMAFGTGNHETTILSLEFLEKYLKEGDDLIDIGTGSGILSIGAKLMGAGRVIGADLDKESVSISRDNALLNEVDIEFLESNLFSNIDMKADIVVANIVAEIIVKLIPDLKYHLNKDGYFIASGIIDDRIDLIDRELEKYGFEIIDKSRMNEWNSLVARYKNV